MTDTTEGYKRFMHSLEKFTQDGVMVEKMTRLTKLDNQCIALANEFDMTEQVLERLEETSQNLLEEASEEDLQDVKNQMEYIALRYKQTMEMVSELEGEIWIEV